ncbi:hypothetical protein D3C87_1774260 [compost metagenome]
MGATADEHVVRTAGYLCTAGDLVALARCRSAVDEDVGRAFSDLHRTGMLVAGANAFFDMGSLAAIDEYIRRCEDDGPGGR